MERETGDYFYRARYYDPGTGRFLSEDPIGFHSGEVNLFRYVKNRPLDLKDPKGEGIVTFGVCAIIEAVNAASTINELRALDKQLEEINRRKTALSKACPLPGKEGELLRQEEALRQEGLRISAAKTRTLAKGSLIGLSTGLICTGLLALPL